MTLVWAIIGAFGLNLCLGLGSSQKYTVSDGGGGATGSPMGLLLTITYS